MNILFSNLPWFESDDMGNPRQGIRCGSRWPFTRQAFHKPDEFQFGGYLPFPFFLSMAAGMTKQLIEGSTVTVRDSIARGESYTSFGRALIQNPQDFIVIETATPAWEHDEQLIKWIGTFSQAKIILCGTLDRDNLDKILFDNKNIHAIVRGEYDKLIARAINSPVGVHEHSLLTKEEMNKSPFPIWDEACATHYWDACPEGQRSPQLQMWTSRGCPFRCVFCVWPAVMTGNDPTGEEPRSVRYYSQEYVEAYIRERLSKVSYQSIYLDDDTANLSDKHTLAICEVMKRIGLPWSAMCRADTIKKDAWVKMKESGCFGVKIGFESGSQYVIDHIVNKKLDLKAAYETCLWLQKEVGIKVHTTWTIGLPGETKEQAQETLDMIQMMYKTGAHTTHQLSGTSVIEGTPLHTITQKGHLDKYDGAKIDGTFINTGDGQSKIERMMK